MKHWESLVDKKIREAMEQGEFDELRGKGAPVDLTENPFADPDWRTAYRLLRNAGFAPAWIEERKDIDAAIDDARIQLKRAWIVLVNARGSEHQSEAEDRWERSVALFKKQAKQLNRRIAAWNLKVPSTGFQRPGINEQRQIEEIKRD